MQSTDDILSADKLLFAIDLVDHVIMRTRPSFGEKTLNILARADRLRNITYNRFNRTIRKALNIIDVNQDTSVFNEFAKMVDEKRVTKESFIEYANKYRELNFSGGFQAKTFLIYCDSVANMAGYFLSSGVEDAADFAVESIMQGFPQSIMYHATWNEITKVAATLEELGNGYYEGMSSDSSSESSDHKTSETEDSTSDSVNMDVNISSPDDSSQTNIDNVPSILKNALERKNTKNISYKAIVIGFPEAINTQSSDSSYSLAFSSLSKQFSSSNASPVSTEEREMPK